MNSFDLKVNLTTLSGITTIAIPESKSKIGALCGRVIEWIQNQSSAVVKNRLKFVVIGLLASVVLYGLSKVIFTNKEKIKEVSEGSIITNPDEPSKLDDPSKQEEIIKGKSEKCIEEYAKKKKEAIDSIQLKYLSLDSLDEDMKSDEDVVLAAVTKNGFDLNYASENLKNNEKIVLVAMEKSPHTLKFASANLKDNEKVVLTGVNKNPQVLQYASDKLKGNEELVLAAVTKSGVALQYANEGLKANEKIVLVAVKCHGYSLQYASENLRANEKIVLVAVKKHGCALQFASENLRNDEKIVLAAVTQEGNAIQFASEELKSNENILQAALKNGYNPNASQQLVDTNADIAPALFKLIGLDVE